MCVRKHVHGIVGRERGMRNQTAPLVAAAHALTVGRLGTSPFTLPRVRRSLQARTISLATSCGAPCDEYLVSKVNSQNSTSAHGTKPCEFY